MSGRGYAGGKRAREAEKARKKKEKAERRKRRKANAGGGIPIASVEEIQVAAMSEPAAMPREPGAAGGAGSQPVRLFVGGLSYRTTESDLREVFSKHGEVTDACIIKDRDTGDSRGFGFVTLSDNKDAQKAIKSLDGQDLDGRRMRVSIAASRD